MNSRSILSIQRQESSGRAPSDRTSAIRVAFIALLATVLCGPVGCRSSRLIVAGKGSFVFQHESLNRGVPITVWTYRPSGYDADSPVVFVIHGNSRIARQYRDAWVEIAELHNALLLLPHFTNEVFPGSPYFNMGNMFRMDSLEHIIEANPENEWSYSLIDPIFDHVVEQMKNHSKRYLIFGHSAGSQFVHRFLYFKPEARVRRAVCANAGWYTMPDFDEPFPYGLQGTGSDLATLRRLFEKKVTVLLGDQDTDRDHRSLRRTPQAMRQGAHRFKRGQNFFAACTRAARDAELPFQWRLEVVPGVAHSNAQMAPSAARVLFAEQY